MRFSYRWYIICLSVFNFLFVLFFRNLIWCVFSWISLRIFCFRFTHLLGSVGLYLSTNLRSFSHYFFAYFFSFTFFLLLSETPMKLKLDFYYRCTGSWGCVYFTFQTIFSLLFGLDKFYWSFLSNSLILFSIIYHLFIIDPSSKFFFFYFCHFIF